MTNGPVLELFVDGELPGATLDRKAADTLDVRVRLRSHPDIGQPKQLRLFSNEGPLHEVKLDATAMKKVEGWIEYEQQWKVPVKQSRWLVADVTL